MSLIEKAWVNSTINAFSSSASVLKNTMVAFFSDIELAIRDLSFARQRIAFDIKKTIESAVANAENNNQFDIDNLHIKEAYVGKSIVLKRFRARAKGRASAIKKPYTNLTIILAEKIKEEKELHGSKS